jgi:hypothetical protein
MSCSVDLSVINKVCGPNIPGNIELYVANEADLDTVPAADSESSIISSDITMVATKYFRRFTFTKKTCNHTETGLLNGQVQGLVEANFDHDDDAKRYQFEQMSGGEYALIVVDGNELPKLIRNAEFRRDFQSGLAGEDVNGYTARFEYEGPAAKIYQGAIPEEAV